MAIDDEVALWASKPISLGGGNRFTPLVLGRSVVPEITDPDQAIADPELAVLSSMAHGCDDDVHKALRIARAADAAAQLLDMERMALYCDLIDTYLSEAAREAFKTMNPARYVPQSEFGRQCFDKGEAIGEAKGRTALITKQLSARFGALSAQVTEQIDRASIEELDAIGERLLTAKTLDEALNPR